MMSLEQYIKRERQADEKRLKRMVAAQKKPNIAKIVIVAVAAFFAVGFATSIVHETGHGLVCASSGFDYRLWVDLAGGHMVCSGAPNNSSVYDAMGPALGATVAIPILFVGLKKRAIWLIPGAASVAVDQVVKIALEGFANSLYASGAINGFISAMQAGTFIVVLGLLLMKQKKLSMQKGEGS